MYDVKIFFFLISLLFAPFSEAKTSLKWLDTAGTSMKIVYSVGIYLAIKLVFSSGCP